MGVKFSEDFIGKTDYELFSKEDADREGGWRLQNLAILPNLCGDFEMASRKIYRIGQKRKKWL